MAQAWLDAPEVAFFMLGSTGVLNAQAFTFGAMDEAHLLVDVLMQAAALMDTGDAPHAFTAARGDSASMHPK